MLAKKLDGGRLLLTQGVEGSGQDYGNRSCLRHGGDAILVHIFKMFCRYRAIRSGKPCAMEIGKLLGMKLDRQAQRCCRVKDAGNLGGREGNALAEAIDSVDKALGMGRIQGRNADVVDVGVSPVLVFRGNGVGAEKTGDDAHLPQ